jgi:RNA polymerase sigma-70 factor (ECF subfamily)
LELNEIDVSVIEAHRPFLFALAYRMLGNAGDAEDVLQDVFLRVLAAPRTDVHSPRAYLSTIVTRLCLDRLKSAQAVREHYTGPWLPEPVLTEAAADNPQDIAELHESISLAFLLLLESLTPQERAVLLLRDVFGYEFDEIAAILQLRPANCRQVLHRARERIANRRPRFQVATAQHHALVTRFLAATEQGDVAALTHMLTKDVTLWVDGGGKVPAPRKPVVGGATVAGALLWFARRIAEAAQDTGKTLHAGFAHVNAQPAALVWTGEMLDSVIAFEIDGDKITALRLIRNPEKLRFVASQVRDNAPVRSDASAP